MREGERVRESVRVCASVCEVSEEERGREGYRRKDRVSARGRSNIKLWNRVVNLFSDVSGYFPVTFRSIITVFDSEGT